MPKTVKRKRRANGLPWYWKKRDYWVMPGDPKKPSLRDKNGDIIRGEVNEAAAMSAWHDSMSLTHAGRAGAENEVKFILEHYLQDCLKRVTDKTLANYQDWFQSFIDQWPGLLVRDLKPYHIKQWWERSRPKWGSSMQNLSGSALKAAFNWAAQAGKGGAIIPNSPLEGMELPPMRKRSAEVIITQEEHDKLLALVKSESVRDILIVAWETGTRPINLHRVTRANLTAEKNALLLADFNTAPETPVHKTFKQTGRPLVIPLPPPAQAIVLRLAAKYPEGPLFRTTTGLAWTDVRLANVVLHYAKRAKLQGRFTAYSNRHTRATSLLEQGMSPGDVAAILGNTPGVIHRNYSHVASNTDRLLKLMEAGKSAT